MWYKVPVKWKAAIMSDDNANDSSGIDGLELGPRRRQRTCPKRASKNTAPIVYGYPSEEGIEGAKKG